MLRTQKAAGARTERLKRDLRSQFTLAPLIKKIRRFTLLEGGVYSDSFSSGWWEIRKAKWTEIVDFPVALAPGSGAHLQATCTGRRSDVGVVRINSCSRPGMEFAALDSAEKAKFARKIYALLGLGVGCGEAAVKKAYKKASLQYHPDKQRGKTAGEQEVAASMFLKVKEAYEMLGNVSMREALDSAVFCVERAQRAHQQRMAAMGSTRRKFRDELERREAAARDAVGSGGGGLASSAVVCRDGVDGAEALARAANASRAEGLSKAVRTAAKQRRAARDTGSDIDRDIRLERLRQSVKVRWGARATGWTDDNLRDACAPLGSLVAIDRGESGKSAILVFASDIQATLATVDETFCDLFRDVRLLAPDAWERVQRAIADRARKDRDEAPDLFNSQRGDDKDPTILLRRAHERADIEATLRRVDASGHHQCQNAPEAHRISRNQFSPVGKRRRLEAASSRVSVVTT